MSKNIASDDQLDSNEDRHEAFADAFGLNTDPLAKFDAEFKAVDDDPFELWLDENVRGNGKASDTIKMYERRVRQWREFMAENYDRHPACPTTRHAIDFARYYLEDEGNQPGTVAAKLGTLSTVFTFLNTSPSFPQGKSVEVDKDNAVKFFDPFSAARGKIDLSDDDPKDPRPIPMPELRSFIQDEVKHIRDRGLIVTGFKLGLRASEVSNIKLSEVHIANSELQDHYDDLGSHPVLEGRPNAVYIPHDRPRNKRERPTVLPLDDELRRVLKHYLLCRPDNGRPWLFLSKEGGKKVDHTNINDAWKRYFRPKYGPTDRFRGVTSHYGRHVFTTYFEQEKEWPPTLVDYMRGDKPGGSGDMGSRRTAVESYVHTHFEDVADRYRKEIYKFRI